VGVVQASSSFSHYPALPPPLRVSLLVLPEHDCPYLPGRRSLSRAFMVGRLPGEAYHRFMDAGFRRSGRLVYQPVCRGCRACVPLRVPVATFAASKSQRRCWRRNQDLIVTAGDPDPTDEKYELYRRYATEWHGKADDDGEGRDTFESFLYDSPVDTVEFQYRDDAGRLLAVGICDLCDRSLSSVYFYHDPAEARRGLGTFGALYEIEWARARGVPHYYLGYWVAACGTMQYKATFRPCEGLDPDGSWRPLVATPAAAAPGGADAPE
jgi:arginine-tRNA-protein transferase